MTDLDTGTPFVNGTEANATSVNAQFSAIETFVNTTGVHVYQAATIVNAAISASAEIAVSKLADGAAYDVLGTSSDGTTVAWVSGLTASHLASDCVTTAKILDLNVTTGKLAAGAVTDSKVTDVAASKVTITDAAGDFTATDVEGALAEIQTDIESISAGGVADGSITAAKLAANAVETAKILDGNVTTPKLGSALASQLGLTSAGTEVRRGKSIIATAESTTSTSYTTLTTPDTVSVTLPSNGLIRIRYMALIKLAAALNDASISIFLGANQVKVSTANGAPSVLGAVIPSAADNYSGIVSSPSELFVQVQSNSSDSTLVGTGTVLAIAGTGGGDIVIQADAGTYDVSVKYKVDATNGGTLSVKERKLWVEAIGF